MANKFPYILIVAHLLQLVNIFAKQIFCLYYFCNFPQNPKTPIMQFIQRPALSGNFLFTFTVNQMSDDLFENQISHRRQRMSLHKIPVNYVAAVFQHLLYLGNSLKALESLLLVGNNKV